MSNLSTDNIVSESTMPYLHLDLAQTYPSETKRELAPRLCHLYADVMQTQLWRPNVGIAELGEDNLLHLGKNGLESITMVLVEIRRGRSLDLRLELGRRIVDICAEVLGVPKRTVTGSGRYVFETNSSRKPASHASRPTSSTVRTATVPLAGQ
jgi:hypothetical protein